MNIAAPLLTIAAFIGYSLLEGKREAWYFYSKNVNPNPPKFANEHPIFAAQRFLVIVATAYVSLNMYKDISTYHNFFWTFFCTCLGLALLFPFFHDGMYYTAYNKLNSRVYTRKWVDESSTSNALMNFNFADRVALLTLGVIILAVTFFILFLRK